MNPNIRLTVMAVGAVLVVGLAVLARSVADSPSLFAVVVVAGMLAIWGVVVVIQYLVNKDSEDRRR